MLALAFALAGDAQPSADRELDIELDEEACRAVTGVSVVYNYDDTAYRATKTTDCHWKYSIPTFTTTIPFSLRLNGAGRTQCRHATQVTDRAFRLKFSLPATDEPAKDIRISGSGLRYVRDVPVKRDGDVPCFEVGTVGETLLDVQFDVEDVRVQVFEEKKVGCGLLIDDLWPKPKGKKSKRGTRLKTVGNLNVLGSGAISIPREIAQGVELQGLKGMQCHAPAIIPFAVIEKTLGGKSSLTIEVK